MNKRVAVIGGGLGGMSAAIYLRKMGYEIDLYEKNDSLGGKLNQNILGQYRFDTGPTLMTMPFVLERIFRFAGYQMDKYIEIAEIDPISRNFFKDGTILDTHKDLDNMQRNISEISVEDSEKFREFMEYSKRLYELAAEIFLFEPFHEVSRLWQEKKMPPINTAFKIDAFKTMQERLQEYFKNEKVLQLFGRFATYNGSNPYQIPATLNIIPHVEFTMGSYYVKGGMYNIVESLQNIMKDMGINIFLNTQITEILHDRVAVNGIRVGEEVINYDRVVANSDVVYTFSTMIKGFPDYTIKLRKLEPSLSGMLFHWGVKGRHEQLALHNVFFSDDYKKEFDSIFHSHTHPSSPTIYVSVSSKIDSNHAPDGCENWYVLLNMPYHSGQDWESATQQVRYSVLSDLKTHGIDISDKIECEDVFTPLDFKNKYFSNRGSIYGISSNSMMAAFQRPANRSRLLKNLYFTGGSSHPGGGVPLVILSGRHAAKIIALEDGINFQDFESGEYKRLVVML